VHRWQVLGFFFTYAAIVGLSCATMQRAMICIEPAAEHVAIEIADCVAKDASQTKETCAGIAALKVFGPWLACTWREHVEGRHVKNCPHCRYRTHRDGGSHMLPTHSQPDGGVPDGQAGGGSVFGYYTPFGVPVLDQPTGEERDK
jgi:hypothetical protein